MIKDSGDVIVKTLARLLAPFIVAYALYVVMHGHHSPGGGFQGGVILAASFVLLAITHGVGMMRRKLSERVAEVLSSVGVLIYAGIGFLCIFLGGNYLDYGRLYRVFGGSEAEARSLGILGVEIGVALAVMAVMCTIFLAIYKVGEEDPRDGGRK
jgi:multicomponent Na+:H+ antiporter subunit B